MPIEPRVEQPAGGRETEDKVPDVVREEKVKEDTAATTGALTGLRGIYTENAIVITWDEIDRRDIAYRVYRSTGEDFSLVGETVTPAFTDRDIKPKRKYKYRAAAVVGGSEGPASNEITIVTEIQ
ncbi:MAG: fibronectin type III domain-containing protein [Nitrospirae bacterium]|nr:fibronectin type III domain-containing protein [Nitrospirota bacterium]